MDQKVQNDTPKFSNKNTEKIFTPLDTSKTSIWATTTTETKRKEKLPDSREEPKPEKNIEISEVIDQDDMFLSQIQFDPADVNYEINEEYRDDQLEDLFYLIGQSSRFATQRKLF